MKYYLTIRGVGFKEFLMCNKYVEHNIDYTIKNTKYTKYLHLCRC